MREDWSEVTLGDVAEWHSGGTPKAGVKEFYENGTIPWVVIADLVQTELTSTASSITAAGLEQIGGRMAPTGSVLISMYGTVGRAAIAQIPVATNQAIAWGVPDTSLISSRFLLHVAQLLEPEMIALARGATQRNINREMLRRFKFQLPPVHVQLRIVDVLASIDEFASQLDSTLEKTRNLRSGLLSSLLHRDHEIPDSYDNLLRSL